MNAGEECVATWDPEEAAVRLMRNLPRVGLPTIRLMIRTVRDAFVRAHEEAEREKQAGGEAAAETFEYLKSIKDSDSGPKTEPLSDDQMQAYLGEYVAEETGLTMICRTNRNGQLVADFRTSTNQSNGRLLRYTGNDAFFPAGVPSVKVAFVVSGGSAKSGAVKGSVPEIQLTRRA